MVIIVAVKKSLIVDLPFAVRFITWNLCGGKKGALTRVCEKIRIVSDIGNLYHKNSHESFMKSILSLLRSIIILPLI